ncbi:hypothetical protein PF007_g22995 [Phytophthora fragariae]|uniref:Uncharacterized protein n=1 Tax=Phytophthora fragariae TaxID=53985 RepID=A0A6A3E3G6_9STRA|nr:hypothetical protein PF009_g24411 [Phytophthora fragariae]KAE9080574.1 hypothetical protein PF007_g22995 [Phytophthora fragariae]KAE9155927.1 hypothetical protein PF006_g180 [Phytophthora fragariae]KAE9302225.1 hypothetical protein PF001_g14091 [Phytophthora fragariae]
MTTETRIIVRPAPDALRAVGPTKPHAHAPTPTDMEEKPPAPVRKKHSGDPEAAKDASASKKPADTTATATMNETPASTKHAKAADVAKKLPASRKPKVAATKAKAKVKAKTPASPKPTRKTKKVAASSKPAPKKPAAKQIPKKKGPTKESQKALKLPPKRTDVLLPGPQEEVSSDSSDTDIPNPGYVSGADSPVPRTRASTKDNVASANDTTTSPRGVVLRRIRPWEWTTRSRSPTWATRSARSSGRPRRSRMPNGFSIRGAPCLPRLWWRWNAPDSWRRPCLAETTRPLRCRSPKSSPTPVSTRGFLLSCFSLIIGSTWPIVLIRRPLRRWAPSGSRDPRPSHPRSATRAAILDSGRIP